MLKKTLIIIIVMTLAIANNTVAQIIDPYAPQTIFYVDKENYNLLRQQFRKAESFVLNFHYGKTDYAGMKRSEFFKVFSNDYHSMQDSTYVDWLMSRYENCFYAQKGRISFFKSDKGCHFILHMYVKSISHKAGTTATVLITYKDSIPICRFDLSVDDGRWNDFSTLLIENGEKQAETLSKMIRVLQRNFTLYSKQLLIRKRR